MEPSVLRTPAWRLDPVSTPSAPPLGNMRLFLCHSSQSRMALPLAWLSWAFCTCALSLLRTGSTSALTHSCVPSANRTMCLWQVLECFELLNLLQLIFIEGLLLPIYSGKKKPKKNKNKDKPKNQPVQVCPGALSLSLLFFSISLRNLFRYVPKISTIRGCSRLPSISRFFRFPCTHSQFHVTLYFLPLESQSKISHP